jgi:hypothetical protein
MRKTIVISAAILLAACGGGSGGSNTATPPAQSELEGVWVYSTASHLTGSACGLDIHGGYESRATLTFRGTSVTGVQESCLILSGNTGGFVVTANLSGTFQTGEVYLTHGAEIYKTLDVTSNGSTQYSGYAMVGNAFKLAQATVGNDGSTAAKRLNGVGFYDQPKFIKQ